MKNNAGKNKILPFGKILLLILCIAVALQIISGCNSGENVFGSPSGGQNAPTSPTGTVSKAYFGLSGQDTDDNTGVLITSVVAGSPAEKAGIQVGDIITAIGSHMISNSMDFKAAASILDPQVTVDVALTRDAVSITLQITPEGKNEAVTQPQQEATQPQSTNPPQNSSNDLQNRHPSIPTDLLGHILVGSRNNGICATFTGNVLITVVFVNDPTSTWTAEKIASTKAGDNAMTAEILSEAASYGANLNITVEYRQATVSTTEESDRAAWAEQVMASAGLGNIATASAELERARGVQEAPILFYVNATERSYAQPNSGEYTEYAIIWNCGSDTVTYRHELYHLFGAPDLYSPQLVKECAQRYYPNSTMLNVDNAVTDELTAYFIGWTDTLSSNALAFLRETAGISREEADQEYKKETYTGYVENWEKNGDYYTGYLDFGILEGPGKVVYKDGSWYEGDFVYGNLVRGKCKIIYEDGGCYEGQMDQGVISGQGTMVWANGDVYTGQWKDGKYHGKGKLTNANGSWNDGVFESGAFISGQCKIIYEDGSRYEGAMEQGQLSGQGTMIWRSGDSYTGQWKNSQYHGFGKLIYSNDSWYEGNFDRGLFSGQGTYAWPNGDRYTGAFANGKFHGYGTYTWANGDSRSGTWKDGNYVE